MQCNGLKLFENNSDKKYNLPQRLANTKNGGIWTLNRNSIRQSNTGLIQINKKFQIKFNVTTIDTLNI